MINRYSLIFCTAILVSSFVVTLESMQTQAINLGKQIQTLDEDVINWYKQVDATPFISSFNNPNNQYFKDETQRLLQRFKSLFNEYKQTFELQPKNPQLTKSIDDKLTLISQYIPKFYILLTNLRQTLSSINAPNIERSMSSRYDFQFANEKEFVERLNQNREKRDHLRLLLNAFNEQNDPSKQNSFGQMSERLQSNQLIPLLNTARDINDNGILHTYMRAFNHFASELISMKKSLFMVVARLVFIEGFLKKDSDWLTRFKKIFGQKN